MAKAIDLKDKVYGSWKIIERQGTSKSGFARWICKCKCGNEKIFSGIEIRKGKARKDCGCSDSWVGKKFGRLTVLKIGEKGNHNNYILCKCDCGNEKMIWGSNIYQGSSRSCGCINKDKREKRGINSIIITYKSHAKRRKIPFHLSKEDFLNICKENCFYCGCEPSNRFYRKNKDECEVEFIYNGIDRFNNDIGYIFGNCVACCKMCNRMKADLHVEDWIIRMKKILNNFKNNID
jgi:hypothetical protein